MNKTKYLQGDGRWGGLVYPKKPCYIRNVGCGEVSIANILIEMEQYAQYTPATIQPYCKRYGAPNCDGTYWTGIASMMKHYGFTDVKDCATMAELWKELAKGDRVAVYLMGSRPGGSKKIHWTSGGHFVASVDYKVKDGKHYLYVKDPWTDNKNRNGWITYEENMKNDIVQVTVGKLGSKKVVDTPATTADGKLTVDGIGGTATVKATQKFFATAQDGVISGQMEKLKGYYPSITAVEFDKKGGGSVVVRALQKWLGLTQDGIIGQGTTAAWQKRLRDYGYLAKNETIDGIFGVKSMKAWQKFLNNDGKNLNGDDSTPPTDSGDRKVIDVSNFQDAINWAKAKADGVQGVIVKCGYRGAETGLLNEDSMFLKHIKGAYAVGLPVGIYMFTQGKTAEEGKEEADFAIDLWEKAGVPLSFPIAVDTENVYYKKNGKKIAGRANGLSKAKRTTVIKAFCEEIKAKGYEPMIYASTSWLNNKLDMSKLPYNVWCAQYASECEYEGEYIMWQYSSKGKVSGVSGNVDLNHCYIEPKAIDAPSTKPKTYEGKLPTTKITKTNAEVIADTITWAEWIAGDNSFHYGNGTIAHRAGCFFCGTNATKKGTARKWLRTYCCNTFIFSAYAHGGCVTKLLSMCIAGKNSKTYPFYDGKNFKNMGKIAQSKMRAGDILKTYNGDHYELYIGDGKVAQAAFEDDGKEGSTKWNNSIKVSKIDLNGYKCTYRYIGTVDSDMPIRYGEVSERVRLMQEFLIWYGLLKTKANGIYDASTLEAVKKFQEAEVGEPDGIVGEKTIAKMASVSK